MIRPAAAIALVCRWRPLYQTLRGGLPGRQCAVGYTGGDPTKRRTPKDGNSMIASPPPRPTGTSCKKCPACL